MIVLLQVASWVLVGFVAAATASAILFPRRPLLGVAQHWGLQLWWLALLGLAAALTLQLWPAAILGAGAAGYWSLRLFADPRRARRAQPRATPLLRLASANLAHFNGDLDRMVAGLAACAADVIALVEVTPAARDRLQALSASHPHALDTCDLTDRYGVLIRARWPLDALSRSAGGDDVAPRHLAARLHLPHAPLDIIAVHLTNPIRRDIAHRIPGEIADLIARAASGGADLVLCGDCNAAGWSSWLTQLEAATGLCNSGRLLPSWPVRLPAALRLPIDHVWARGRAAVLETRLGPETGSDHFPLLAEIGWRDG